jgi:thymidylate kinase
LFTCGLKPVPFKLTCCFRAFPEVLPVLGMAPSGEALCASVIIKRGFRWRSSMDLARSAGLTEMPAGYAGEAAVRAFLEGLERHCSAYCLLGACNDLPAEVHSDIDFMVSPEDFVRMPQVLAEAGSAAGFRLVQEVEHETTARRFELARNGPGRVCYLHPDSASDFRLKGRKWLRAEEILKRRRRHANGFWVASADDNFHYYLIKSLEKGRLEEPQAQELGRLFTEDPERCLKILAQRLSRESAQGIASACRSGDWHDVFAKVPALHKELMARAPHYPLRDRAAELGRLIRRGKNPAGLWVAVLGPDGSGKSTVIEYLQAALAPAFRRTVRMHLRPQLLRGTSASEIANTDPHGQQMRGVAASTLKLVYFWADYVLGYWGRVRPLLVRNSLVIFDRYYCDLLIDPWRFRSRAPGWLARAIGAMIPMPHLLLILDAPAEVLQTRKQEVTAEESARQAQAYRDFASSGAARGRAVVIDATQTVDEVVRACVDQGLEGMAQRTARRLGTAAGEP